MKPNRRGFLGLMAASPVIGKQVAADVTAAAGATSGALSNGSRRMTRWEYLKHTGCDTGSGSAGAPIISPSNRMAALRIPAARAAIESLYFEDERCVHAIDPDIAVHRSISQSAKIVYQRQRTVQKRVAADSGDYKGVWDRIEAVIGRALGLSA